MPDTSNSESSTFAPDSSPFLSDWGFTLKELYGLALVFFKDKEGKAIHFSYEERLKLIALTSQVAQGKFDPQTAPPLGVLDVIGKDRRMAWQALGEKTQSDSMFEFITTLDKQSPQFKPYVEAHKRDAEDKSRRLKEVQQVENEKAEGYQVAKDLERQIELEKGIQEEQKRRIQDALNHQTYEQFKAYAEQQYPANPEQQGVLIRQLQDQHYEQYMRQIYQQQLFTGKEPIVGDVSQTSDSQKIESEDIEEGNLTSLGDGDGKEGSGSEHEDSSIAAASMWTRKDVKEFKESVRAEGGEAIIKVGQGESVTVRVPTHEDGSCLFWEFATDSYDIGFGLFFEWTNADEPVSVQVTEENSSDEEDDPELSAIQQDIERGRELLPRDAKPNTDIIIPVYRRDAHQEVYVGSHLFPGKGVYLLKFDNSYSFWRSKTLFYRVYYTK